MDIKIESQNQRNICYLSGPVDCNDLDELKLRLSSSETPLEINFQKLEFLGSAGLNALLSIAYTLSAARRSCRLTGLKENARSLLEMSGLQDLLDTGRGFNYQ